MAFTPTSRVRWYALAGGMFGFSISYAFLVFWEPEFHPGTIFELSLDLLLSPTQPRWRRGPTPIQQSLDLLSRMTAQGLVVFGTVWGVAHGIYLALCEPGVKSRRAACAGVASYLVESLVSGDDLAGIFKGEVTDPRRLGNR